MVYAPGAPTVVRSDSVVVTGVVQEYYGKTEINLQGGGSVTVLAERRKVPPPTRINASDMGEPYEGCLVFLENIVVYDDDIGYGEWLVYDTTDTIIVDDLGNYSYTPVIGDSIVLIRGIVDYSYGNFKLEPRGDYDIIRFNRPILAYFSHSVRSDVANVEPRGNFDLDSVLVAWIKQAAFSVDFCIYSIWSWDVVNALKYQYDHGVSVRVIVEHDNLNSYTQSLENHGIPVIDDSFGANNGEGRMHNKFLIIDARDSTSTADDHVLTGSYNPSWDPFYAVNNIVVIHDDSVALAYTLEFNEMWGSNTNTPDPFNSKFGQNKTDNTPHQFNVYGIPVSVYFSPSDSPVQRLQDVISAADREIYFSAYTFTHQDVSNAMKSKWDSGTVMVAGVFDTSYFLDSNHWSEAWDMLGLGGGNPWSPPAWVYPDSQHAILHHKYMVIDPDYASSDPTVVTGSMNWTYSGAQYNDENFVVIRDSIIAQQYLQEFAARYTESSGHWPPGYFDISEIQANDPSDYEDLRVVTSGIVTGVYYQSEKFFIGMRPQGPYRGIFVFAGPSTPYQVNEGDSVRIMGIVKEYYNLTEMDVSNGLVETINTGLPLPDPVIVPTGTASSEPYEGVLVRVDSAICVDPDLGYGEWAVDDGSGSLIVDDLGVPYSPDSGLMYSVTGPIYFSFGEYKIEPRDSSDIVVLFVQGDVNGDGILNLSDLQFLSGYLFLNGVPPSPLQRGDVNLDGSVDARDVVYLSAILFSSNKR